MKTELDQAEHWHLARLDYEGSRLKVQCTSAASGLVTVVFPQPLAFFVLEESFDAVTYAAPEFNRDEGFLKVFPQREDPGERVFFIAGHLIDMSVHHFRLVMQDEVLHVVSTQQALIEQEREEPRSS